MFLSKDLDPMAVIKESFGDYRKSQECLDINGLIYDSRLSSFRKLRLVRSSIVEALSFPPQFLTEIMVFSKSIQ